MRSGIGRLVALGVDEANVMFVSFKSLALTDEVDRPSIASIPIDSVSFESAESLKLTSAWISIDRVLLKSVEPLQLSSAGVHGALSIAGDGLFHVRERFESPTGEDGAF